MRKIDDILQISVKCAIIINVRRARIMKAVFTHRDYNVKQKHPVMQDATVSFDGSPEVTEVLGEIMRTRKYDIEWVGDYEMSLILPDIRECDSKIIDMEMQQEEMKKGSRLQRFFKVGERYRQYMELERQLRVQKAHRSLLIADKNDAQVVGYNDATVTSRYAATLGELGFVVDSSRKDDRGVVIESMTSTLSEEELMKRATEMLAELRTDIERRKAEVAYRYGVTYTPDAPQSNASQNTL